jgi:DNA-binding response OmpR family regulator
MQIGTLRDQVVVVIDDASSFAPGLQESLENAGATVARLPLQDAPKALDEGKLSVAIVDCYPPSRERRALIRRLRQEQVPFLFYSAEPPSDVTTERGAPFIARPCSPAKMVAAVRYLVGRL